MEPEKAWGGGHHAFELNPEDTVAVAPVEGDREGGASDRSERVKSL